MVFSSRGGNCSVRSIEKPYGLSFRPPAAAQSERPSAPTLPEHVPDAIACQANFARPDRRLEKHRGLIVEMERVPRRFCGSTIGAGPMEVSSHFGASRIRPVP
jgi:hypothetical protein